MQHPNTLHNTSKLISHLGVCAKRQLKAVQTQIYSNHMTTSWIFMTLKRQKHKLLSNPLGGTISNVEKNHRLEPHPSWNHGGFPSPPPRHVTIALALMFGALGGLGSAGFLVNRNSWFHTIPLIAIDFLAVASKHPLWIGWIDYTYWYGILQYHMYFMIFLCDTGVMIAWVYRVQVGE